MTSVTKAGKFLTYVRSGALASAMKAGGKRKSNPWEPVPPPKVSLKPCPWDDTPALDGKAGWPNGPGIGVRG